MSPLAVGEGGDGLCYDVSSFLFTVDVCKSQRSEDLNSRLSVSPSAIKSSIDTGAVTGAVAVIFIEECV